MAGLLIGLGLIAIAAVIAVDVSGMRVPPVHAKVGPRFFPLLVSCGLAVAGAVTAWQSWRGTFDSEDMPPTDWAQNLTPFRFAAAARPSTRDFVFAVSAS